MLYQRLVSLIEAHAEEMARQVVSEALTNPRTPHIGRIPSDEMHRRAYDVYHNLGKWLGQQAETAIEETYRKLGWKRAEEGIPLEEVVYGQMLRSLLGPGRLRIVSIAGSPRARVGRGRSPPRPSHRP